MVAGAGQKEKNEFEGGVRAFGIQAIGLEFLAQNLPPQSGATARASVLLDGLFGDTAKAGQRWRQKVGRDHTSGRAQQAILRSALFTAHARGRPALTEEKVPAGDTSSGVDVSPAPEPPQHATEPSALTPHAAVTLALMDAKAPVGGHVSRSL